MLTDTSKHRTGFTLVELMVSVAVIGVISGIVVASIGPKKVFIKARDTERIHTSREISSAIYQHLVEAWEMSGGDAVPDCTSNDINCAKPICKDSTSTEDCISLGGVDLRTLLPDYLKALPIDPTIARMDDEPCTGYMVYKNAGRPRVFSGNLGKLPQDDPEPKCLCGSGGAGEMGNAVIDGDEECDDGDTDPGDGCDSDGNIEDGWTCTGEPSDCDEIPTCNGQTATVYVNASNIIVGGSGDGEVYDGTLNGGNFLQVMVGTSGADTINGDNQNDIICGGDGDDIINGGGGSDIMFGEGGNDTITGGNGADILCGGGGSDKLYGLNGEDKIDGGVGTEITVDGGNGSFDICRNGENVINCEDVTSGIEECEVGVASCGDGAVNEDSGEECDDGDTDDGDGCSAICELEDGWECDDSEPSICGEEVAFTCGGILTDARDSKEYATVLIGSQCWMAENLDYGTKVNTWEFHSQSDNGIFEKWCYSNSDLLCTIDSALYTWGEALQYGSPCNGTGEGNEACASPVQGVCPSGWHIPSHYEFVTLERAICTSGSCNTDFPYDTSTVGLRGTDEGIAIKAGGSSGFEFQLSGYIMQGGGTSKFRNGVGEVWTSSQTAWIRHVDRSTGSIEKISRGEADELYGYSVRCIKD